MLKEDLNVLIELINQYGAKEAVNGLTVALQEYANEMSDLRLKDRVAEAILMLDRIENINNS